MLNKIPTSAEFQSSTNLKVAFSQKRSADTILMRIDGLLDIYNGGSLRSDAARIAMLGKLYFALDRWLQLADKKSPLVNERRRPAVYELYVFVVRLLCQDVKVPVNLLPFWLNETFGKSMVDHGAEVDLQNKSANYISQDKLQKFRLEFRSGLAFQQDFIHNSTAMILANSADIRINDKLKNPIHEGFSGYVVGMNGDFYSSPHMEGTSNQGNGFFHSSYLGGQEVMCAGEIKIVKGMVQKINNDSGHYHPSLKNVVMAVEMLAMYGVDLTRMTVSGHGLVHSTGAEFLKNNGAIGVTLRPLAPGNTPVGRHQQAATISQVGEAKKAALAFAKFKSHCSPVARPPVHSWTKRGTCLECKEFLEGFEKAFTRAVSEQGGIDKVKIPVVIDPKTLNGQGTEDALNMERRMANAGVFRP